jgi:hypothetical protein
MNAASSQPVRAVFGLQDRLLKATVSTGGRPLVDLLQDRAIEGLVLRDVQMYGGGEAGSRIFIPDCVVRKSQILIVVPTTGPANRSPERYAAGAKATGFLILPGYTVTGQLDLPHSGGAILSFDSTPGEFLTLAGGSVRPTFDSSSMLEGQVVLVNKSQVSVHSTGQESPIFDTERAEEWSREVHAVTDSERLYQEIHDLMHEVRQLVGQKAAGSVPQKSPAMQIAR